MEYPIYCINTLQSAQSAQSAQTPEPDDELAKHMLEFLTNPYVWLAFITISILIEFINRSNQKHLIDLKLKEIQNNTIQDSISSSDPSKDFPLEKINSVPSSDPSKDFPLEKINSSNMEDAVSSLLHMSSDFYLSFAFFLVFLFYFY